MIGIALITLVTVLTASVRDTIDDVFTGGINGEVVASSADQVSFTGFPTAFGDAAEALPEVAVMSRVQSGVVIHEGTENFIASIDDRAGDMFQIDRLEGTLTPGETGLLVSDRMAEDNGWGLGTTVDLTFEQTGTHTFTVEGIVDSPVLDGLAMSREGFAANYAIPTDSQVYFLLSEGVTPDEGVTAIQAVADDYPSVQVQTLDAQSEELQDSIGSLLSLFTALLGLTILISLFGVMNTLLLSVYERTGEIGLLRAVGLDRTQTRRMIRSEAAIIAVLGAVLGVGLGILFAWAVVQALAEEGFSGFSIPGVSLLVWIAVTAVLAVVFALLPAWRASRLDVLDAIAYE
jgi:putative ABC transport system permease protein